MLVSDTPVSIDIGTTSVRVAQVRGGRSGPRSVRFAEAALPPGFHWESGSDVAPLVEAIRAALRQAGLRARTAVIALPRRHVTARISAFPPTDRAQLANVVQYDLADHIPFPVEQVVVDFQPLGPSVEQPGMTDVLVVAAQRDLVQQHMSLVRALGMRLAALTVDAFAVHDLAAVRGEEPAGISLELEIGRRATTINVSTRNRLYLTRSVPLGVQQLVAALRDDLGISQEEAEARRLREGLHVLDGETRPLRVSAWLDNLRGEIRRSALSFGQAVVSRISLVGAAAATPGLAEALEKEFGAKAMHLTPAALFPTAQLRGPGEDVADRCLLAMGMGLRSLGLSGFSISLVPHEVTAAQKGVLARRLTAAGAVVGVAALALTYFSSTSDLAFQTVQASQLAGKLESVEKSNQEVDTINAEQAQLKKELDSLQPVEARRYQSLELLRTVSEGAGKQIVLGSFSLRPDQPLTLRGTAPSNAAAADLQAFLARSPLVTTVTLDRIDRVQQLTTGPAPTLPPLPVAGRVMQRGRQALRPGAKAAPPKTPAEATTVNFSMTVHLWTEKAAKAKRSTLRRPKVETP